MSKFEWYDRAACIRRIAVLVQCVEGYNLDRALDEAVRKLDGEKYRYCNNPDAMPASVREKLRKDAQYFLDVPERLIAIGRQRENNLVGAGA